MMGQQIVKQPNGLYAIWSSVVDSFTSVDNTMDEIVESWAAEHRQQLQNKVSDVIAQLESGKQPYFQFTKSFDECLETMRKLHGQESVNDILTLVEDAQNYRVSENRE